MITIKDKENNIYYKNNPEYFEEAVKLFNEHPKHFNRMLAHSKKYLGDWINSQLPLLQDKAYAFSTKLYWIFTNRTNFPMCEYEHCDKIFGMNRNVNVMTGYAHYCCNKHSQLDIRTINKVKHTKLVNHGNENYCNIEKIKQTKLEHFGDPNYNNMEKHKQTKKQLYGDPYYINKEKARQTRLKRYNGNYIFDDYVQKCEETYLKRTNGKYRRPLQNPDVRLKMERKYFYDNQFFDSSWEVAFYIWHKDHNIEIKHEPFAIEYISIDNKKHIYHPDFLVNENELIEIKGPQFLKIENDKLVLINPFIKTKEAQEHAKFLYNEVMMKNNVKIISNNDIKIYLDYVRNEYGDKYIRTFGIKYNKKEE